MNQKDWVEYFEAVNGRKPTASEFSEALKNKEFTLQSNQDDNRQKELKDALDEQKSIIDKEDWIASFEANNGRRPTPAEFSEALNRGEFVFSSDTQQDLPNLNSRLYIGLIILSLIFLVLIFLEHISNAMYFRGYLVSYGNWLSLVSTFSMLLGVGVGSHGLIGKKVWVKELWILMIISLASIVVLGYHIFAFWGSFFIPYLMLLLIVEVVKIAMIWNAKNKLPAKTKFIKTNNYNQPSDEFQLKKHGLWMNFLLVFINFLLLFFIFTLINEEAIYRYGGGGGLLLWLAVLAVILSCINLIPTFISHTRWKYLIYFINIFLGPTIIGWLVLLIVAIVTNNNAKRDQEMAFLMRKISDKVGGDK